MSSKSSAARFYSPREEAVNTLIHGSGIAIALGGVLALLVIAPWSSFLEVFALLVYGASLLLMYTASTIYHGTRHAGRKALFRKFDHCAIFLLIAGTYTPLMLLAVKTGLGYVVLGIIWFLAVGGIVMKCFTLRSFYGLSVILYGVMGWLCMCCIGSLYHGMTPPAFVFLIGGGVFYTLGIVFYLIERPYFHAVWHVFVIIGSSLHFLTIAMLIGG